MGTAIEGWRWKCITWVCLRFIAFVCIPEHGDSDRGVRKDGADGLQGIQGAAIRYPGTYFPSLDLCYPASFRRFSSDERPCAPRFSTVIPQFFIIAPKSLRGAVDSDSRPCQKIAALFAFTNIIVDGLWNFAVRTL